MECGNCDSMSSVGGGYFGYVGGPDGDKGRSES